MEQTKLPIAKTARVPWHPAAGVVFTIVIFYVAQLLGFFIISLYPALRGWSSHQTEDWLTNSVGGQFAYILVAEALTLAAIFYFLKYYRAPLRSIGLRRPRWSDVGYGLLAVPVYLVLYLLTVGVVSHVVPGLNVNQTQQIGFNDVHGALPLILTYISLAVLPPITEEIMVRGVLYSSLRKGLPLIWAVLLTSALFASAHLPEGGAAGPLYIAALDTFVLSLVLIYLREKTGGLWASILLHAIKNSIAFAVLFVFTGR